jgi:hypothetical protein
MIAAIILKRRIMIQSGERAALSSCEMIFINKRTGGKAICAGAGGVIRSSHHKAGNPTKASNSHGDTNDMAPSENTL